MWYSSPQIIILFEDLLSKSCHNKEFKEFGVWLVYQVAFDGKWTMKSSWIQLCAIFNNRMFFNLYHARGRPSTTAFFELVEVILVKLSSYTRTFPQFSNNCHHPHTQYMNHIARKCISLLCSKSTRFSIYFFGRWNANSAPIVGIVVGCLPCMYILAHSQLSVIQRAVTQQQTTGFSTRGQPHRTDPFR